MAAKLTAKQRRFCHEYIIDQNATKAAIRAGYSAKHASEMGYALLQKPHVRAFIEELQAEQAKRLDITADRVKLEWARIAFSDIRNAVEWNKYRVSLKDSSQIDDNTAAAISEISETITLAGGSKKIKFHNKNQALEMLAKHFGMLDGKREVEENSGAGYLDALKGTAEQVWADDEEEAEADE